MKPNSITRGKHRWILELLTKKFSPNPKFSPVFATVFTDVPLRLTLYCMQLTDCSLRHNKREVKTLGYINLSMCDVVLGEYPSINNLELL